MNDWEMIDPTTWYCSWPNCDEQATYQEVLIDGAGSIRGFLADAVIRSCKKHMRLDINGGDLQPGEMQAVAPMVWPN